MAMVMGIISYNNKEAGVEIIDDKLRVTHIPKEINFIKEIISGETIRKQKANMSKILNMQRTANKIRRQITFTYSLFSSLIFLLIGSLSWIIFYTLTLLDSSFFIGAFLLAIGLSLAMATDTIDIYNAASIFEEKYNILPGSDYLRDLCFTLIMYGSDLIALGILISITAMMLTSFNKIILIGKNKKYEKYIEITDKLFGYNIVRP